MMVYILYKQTPQKISKEVILEKEKSGQVNNYKESISSFPVPLDEV